jgi:hypothetical protein
MRGGRSTAAIVLALAAIVAALVTIPGGER